MQGTLRSEVYNTCVKNTHDPDMRTPYLPADLLRQIGFSVLNMNELASFYNFCLTSSGIMQALEQEFKDLFGKHKPRKHTDFKSMYLVQKMCNPLVSKLSDLVLGMQKEKHLTGLWLNGGIVDMENIILDVTSCLPNRRVLQCVKDCVVSRNLSRSQHATRSHLERINPPLLLIMLGVDQSAWTYPHLKNWVMNHMCYNTSMIYVSNSTLPNPPAAVKCNIDRMVKLDGIELYEEIM